MTYAARREQRRAMTQAATTATAPMKAADRRRLAPAAAMAARLKAAGIDFLLEPYIRFEGLPGEQATLFIRDPSGNALEFKSFKDMSQLFATD